MADDARKGAPTPRAPQNRRQTAPQVPPTTTTAFCGEVDLQFIPESPLGALQVFVASVPGGRIKLHWPIEFAPTIIGALQEHYDDFKAGKFAEGQPDTPEIAVVENKLIIPGG